MLAPDINYSGLTTAERAFVQNLAGLSYVNGDILYYNSGALQRLPIGSSTNVLTVSAGLPAWTAAISGITTLNTLTAATQTFANANDTNVTLSIGSATSTHTFTMGWTGTLAPSRGGFGTDVSAIAKGGLVTGTAAGTFGIKAVGSDGQVLSADSTQAGGVKWIAAGGTGTVTTVSVVSANGFAGSVATATTTPAITISTSITGTLQGNGTAISASKVTLTQPATGSTLTILDGKTATFNNTIIFAGTDSTTMTFPSTSATIARTDAANTFTGVQTMTSPALTTPAITGLATGSGVASAATASTLVSRDANANTTVNNLLEGYTTTTTAAGITTLTVGSTYAQFFTGSTTQTVTLPVASTLVLGQQFLIVNNSTGAVTVNSSGANAVIVLAGSTSAVITCILTSGTTAASWSAAYYGDAVASGKKLSVSNSLTLAGTDGKSLTLTNSLTVTTNDGTLAFGAASKTLTVNKSLTLDGTDSTTMTFPSTSATIARTDAGQTFTGVNVFTSPKIITQISDTNGNAWLSIVATASAVNSLQVTNAATGSTGPLLKPVGETNVDLRVGGLGTGKVAFQSSTNHGDFNAYFTEHDNGNTGTAKTVDWTLSNKQKATLTGNCTFTFTSPNGPCSIVLYLAQDATGSRTVTWPATVHWSGGTAPTLTTTASKVDIIAFYWNGSTYYGTSSLNYTA